MLYILLGPDDYSKKQYISALVNPVRDDDGIKPPFISRKSGLTTAAIVGGIL